MSDEPAIELDRVSKAFRLPAERQPGWRGRIGTLRPVARSARTQPVIDGISLTVERGETLGIVGRNGAGKSTLMRLLAGIFQPDSGSVRVQGSIAPFLELGVGFNPQLSVEDNVMINGIMLGMDASAVRRRRDAILDLAGVASMRRAPLKTLSSGMRVRLGFSIMREAEPDVLLVDEVLSVGDAEFRNRTTETFAELHEAGCTIVLVTHNLRQLEQMADRAIMLEDGRIGAEGEPSEVIAAYEDLVANPAARQAARQERDAERARVQELSVSLGKDGAIQAEAAIVATRTLDAASLELDIWSGGSLLVRGRPAPGGELNLEPGETATMEARLELPLEPGRYRVGATVTDQRNGDRRAVSPSRVIPLEVPGPHSAAALSAKIEIEIEPTGPLSIEPGQGSND